MNNLDNYIIETLKKPINKPSHYEDAIKNAFQDKQILIYKMKFMKLATVICSFIILSTGIVYAKDIEKIIVNFFNKHTGMNSAIENGYIDNPKMNYVESESPATIVVLETEKDTESPISTNNNDLIIPVDMTGISTEEPSSEEIQIFNSNNTNIKINNLLMDDYNLSLTFSIKVDDNIDVSKIRKLRLPNMIISDENHNIIYCENKDTFNNYCTTNNLNFNFLEFGEHYNNNERNWYIKSKSLEDNTLTFVMNLNSIVYQYPKSHKLYINFSQINMTEREIYQNEEYILNGNWNIEYNVPAKFYNRENIIYNVTYCSDNKLTITEACVYNTGMVFEFTSQDKPMFNETDSIEVKREKQKQFLKDRETNQFINSEYIENEYGQQFYSVSDGTQTAGTIYETTGKFKHWQTFELTPADATNKLTIHINLFLHGYERDVVIQLERE